MKGSAMYDLTHANSELCNGCDECGGCDECDGRDGCECEPRESREEREHAQRYYDRAVREAAYLDDYGVAEWDV